jgi:hypothetical protein
VGPVETNPAVVEPTAAELTAIDLTAMKPIVVGLVEGLIERLRD